MGAEPARVLNLFYCYARKDKDLRDALDIHLTPLKRSGLITSWFDGEISPGTDWEQEINTHLNTTHIILLLISSDFMASDYCYSKEMKRALERHAAGNACVIPVLLRPVYWKNAPFSKLQALPANAKPVTSWANRDEALEDVARGIFNAIEKFTTRTEASSQIPSNFTFPSNQPGDPKNDPAIMMSGVASHEPEYSTHQTTTPNKLQTIETNPHPTAALLSRPLRPRPPFGSVNRRLILTVVIVALVVASSTIGVAAFLNRKTGNTPLVAHSATGLVSFLDSANGEGHTDALKISVSELSVPSSGTKYSAWLINEQNENAILLGSLSQQHQAFTLYYNGDGKKTNLLGADNRIDITREEGMSFSSVPIGQVVLRGSFPPKAFMHIQHLLVSFPDTSGKIGLLVGLVDQAKKLSSAAQLLQSKAGSGNTAAIQCAAQSIIYIAEGAQGSHYQPLAGQCTSQIITQAGDGYGLLGTGGYIAHVEAHASLAATQADSTDNIKLHANYLGIVIGNLKGWISTIEQDAITLVTNSNDSAKVTEIVKLANQALNGVDINGNKQVDPVPGEAGAITAYTQGQLMASLPLIPI